MTIQERFELFHRENPHVYRRLVELTKEWVGNRPARSRRVGIEMFFAVLRWEHGLTTFDPTSQFKLNDHYTSRYARLIMHDYPELDGVFQLRQLSTL